MSKTLFLLNSDFGVESTIGARALPLARSRKKDELIIIARSYKKGLEKEFNIIKVFPFSKIVMQVFTASSIYVSKRIPSNDIKNNLFDSSVKKKLRKIDIKDISSVHSWEFLPESFAYLKENNPKLRLCVDLPMALPNMLEGIKDKEELFKGESLDVPERVFKSLPYIDRFIVPSEFVRDSVMKIGVDKKKIVVVPFGVDAKKFKPQPKPLRPFRVAFSGNVNNRKGIKYLIEAWTELRLKDAELYIYGRVYPEVKQYLIDAEDKKIIVHGFVNLKEELWKNHIYVFPSLIEGSAKSVYEALASGLPVITTYNSGSVVREGKDGIIIPIQDKRKIKESILYFYNDNNKLKSFSKSAVSRAKEFSWERYAKTIKGIYR